MPEQTGVTVIHVCGSGPLHVVEGSSGRKVRFTFHHYLGPTFYRADEDTVIYGPKRWQWDAFETWLKAQPGSGEDGSAVGPEPSEDRRAATAEEAQ